MIGALSTGYGFQKAKFGLNHSAVPDLAICATFQIAT